MLRTRIPPPVVAFLIAALMRAVAGVPPQWVPHTPILHWIAIVLVAIAVTVDVSALVAFGRARTTANPFTPERASRMVTTGVYRFTRNPMYLGMTLLLCAWAIRQSSLWALVGPVAFGLHDALPDQAGGSSAHREVRRRLRRVHPQCAAMDLTKQRSATRRHSR